MMTIQEAIKRIEAGEPIDSFGDSLCNLDVNDGRIVVAFKHFISPLIISSAKALDADVPVATYCIAVPKPSMRGMLGKKVVLDMSYGGRGVSVNAVVTNNECKLIDMIGGVDNLDTERTTLKDKQKVKTNADGKVEFWDINIISLNQLAAVIN